MEMSSTTSVGRLGDHGKVDLVGEELAQSGANHGVVVNNGNSNHGLWLCSSAHDPTFSGRG